MKEQIKDKHFLGDRIPRVLVTYIEGKGDLEYYRQVLISNSLLFDQILVITPDRFILSEFSTIDKVGVVLIGYEDLIATTIDHHQEFFDCPAKCSDLVCHFAKELVNELTGTYYQAVMYADALTIFYSQFHINELFWTTYSSTGNMYYMYANNFYSRYDKDYLSSYFSFDCRNSEDTNRLRAYIVQFLSDPVNSRYTGIGPTMMNQDRFSDRFCSILPLKMVEHDPRYMYEGQVMNYQVDPKMFCFSLGHTLMRSAGYDFTDMILNPITKELSFRIITND